MIISRRRMLELGGAIALAPTMTPTMAASAAIQQDAGTPRVLLRSHGRYLPRWIELMDDEGERLRVAASLGPEQADLIAGVLRDGKSQYAALVGDEATALADAAFSTLEADETFVALEAVQAIVEASRGHRVVMLNEAHVASRHRSFLARAVRALHGEGFTHLAAETFTSEVRTLGPGDQLSSRHGWYILDPVYAEAVREALDLGMRLVDYEQRENQRSSAPGMSDEATLVREQVQADNFAAVLAEHPEARVLVFVGYGHLAENGPPFASRFKRATGIDPLTVGQSGVGSFGPHAPDTPGVQALLDRLRPTTPVVLLKPGQVPESAASEAALTAEQTDLIVLHPALPDVDGRPGWLAADPGRLSAGVEVPPGVGPRLLQAIHANDVDPAIPADQMLVPDEGGVCTLWLRPGAYRTRVETASGFTSLSEQGELTVTLVRPPT